MSPHETKAKMFYLFVKNHDKSALPYLALLVFALKTNSIRLGNYSFATWKLGVLIVNVLHVQKLIVKYVYNSYEVKGYSLTNFLRRGAKRSLNPLKSFFIIRPMPCVVRLLRVK